MNSLVVKTPFGQDVPIIYIYSLDEFRYFENKYSGQQVGTIPGFPTHQKVFKLSDGRYILQFGEAGFVANTLLDLETLTHNESYDTLSISRFKGKYFYGYGVYSALIHELIHTKTYEILPKYTKRVGYLVYKFEDGSILEFKKRTERVYQGSWYPDVDTFQWFYDNDYSAG